MFKRDNLFSALPTRLGKPWIEREFREDLKQWTED